MQEFVMQVNASSSGEISCNSQYVYKLMQSYISTMSCWHYAIGKIETEVFAKNHTKY